LCHNLAIEQLAHLPIGPELTVATGMAWIVDTTHADMVSSPLLPDNFSPAAGAGMVDGTELVAAESHGVPHSDRIFRDSGEACGAK
jgi:hypothetical protein